MALSEHILDYAGFPVSNGDVIIFPACAGNKTHKHHLSLWKAVVIAYSSQMNRFGNRVQKLYIQRQLKRIKFPRDEFIWIDLSRTPFMIIQKHDHNSKEIIDKINKIDEKEIYEGNTT